MRKNMKRFLLEIAGFLGCICFCGCNSGSGSTSVYSLSKEQAAISVSTDDFIYAATDEIIIPAEKAGKHAYLITYNNADSKYGYNITKDSSKNDELGLCDSVTSREYGSAVVKSRINLNNNNHSLGKNVSRGAHSSSEPNYDNVAVNSSCSMFVTEIGLSLNENGSKFLENPTPITAVKKAVGTYCNIWYYDQDKPCISVSNDAFTALAKKFDTIFQKEKTIFGSNIPTKFYSNTISSVACQRKVNILVYDIDGDAETEQTGGTFGYFHDKDFFERECENGYYCPCSNLAEFIYVDSFFLTKYPVMVYSTLAHEFQHLLFYVNKWLNNDVYISTWNTEMMSMLAEEILQSDLGVNDENSPKNRFAYFKTGSIFGFTDRVWNDENIDGTYEYANTYAFGSFLLHNYGVSYIKKLVSNSYSGTAMITNSLPAGETFDTMLYKFGKSYIDGYYPEINETNFNIPAINLLDSKWTFSESRIKNQYKCDDSLFACYNPCIVSKNHYVYPLYPQGFYVVDLGVIGENGALYPGLKHSDSNVFRFIYLK